VKDCFFGWEGSWFDLVLGVGCWVLGFVGTKSCFCY
jgi:hypothetical protein